MRNNTVNVLTYRRRMKTALVTAFGDECHLCKGKFNRWVFEFHHIDPSTKSFGIASKGITKSKKACAEEAEKCIMLCANCHREVEYGENSYNFKSNFNSDLFYETMDMLSGRFKESNKRVRDNKSKEYNTIIKPSRDELKYLIREESFTEIGRKYGVSDNAVRKWATKFGLPRNKKVINNIPDSEWNLL